MTQGFRITNLQEKSQLRQTVRPIYPRQPRLLDCMERAIPRTPFCDFLQYDRVWRDGTTPGKTLDGVIRELGSDVGKG